mgnify:FL=1
MEMKINLIEQSDYNQFCEWWNYWKFPIPSKEILPNDGIGGLKLTDENGIDLIAGFLYETNSGIAWIEFIVSNPNIKNRNIRKEAKKNIILYLSLLAKEKGYKAIFSSLKDQWLINSFIENGYVKSNEKTFELSIKL